MEPGISFFCLNSKGYLPQPPRVWSRVQNSCSLISGPEEGEFVQVPYSEKIVPYEELGAKIAMLNKGNVLQYKKNSSNLTKQQIYSLIAKGQWTNRTKTWATQSDRGYTNPNNQSYIRVGATNVTLDGVPTFLPVTCPRFPIINNGVLPVIAGGGTQNNVLPPPVPPAPNAGGSVIPLVPVAPVEPIVIQDFGNLVCGTFENLCTGEIIRPILLDNCHPTTDSDVPGPIEELCWNDGNPTWYPRQRYVMSNSTDKWPVNAQLGNAVIFDAPTLSATMLCNVITLSWTFDPFYTSFNIYQDGLIIANVNGFTNTYNVFVYNAGTYSFYIKGVNGNTESEASNTVSVSISQTPAPVLLPITTVCDDATLNWTNSSPCSLTYQVYETTLGLIATTTNTTYNFTLQDNVSYTFYVVAFLGSIASANSNIESAIYVSFSAPTISAGVVYTLNIDVNNVYTYQFTSGTGTITFNSGITNAEILVVGPGGNGGPGDANQVIDEGPGGGGGAGGQINNQSNISFITNQICNVVVGTNPTSSVFDTYNAAAGANGVIITGGVGVNGGGSGGKGGLGTGLAGPTAGANGTLYTIGSIVNITYSGGGGGGSIGPGGGQTGGAGGTGGGGKGSNSGGGVCNPGVANTGGGGGGSSTTDQPVPIPGCPGGSGVVILSFQAPIC
jgi:hypothetical protein